MRTIIVLAVLAILVPPGCTMVDWMNEVERNAFYPGSDYYERLDEQRWRTQTDQRLDAVEAESLRRIFCQPYCGPSW